ncbi:MAG: cell division protein SepF [Erysipelotrichaceae bacterium]|jgi:cell division inhibitor SepF|nr:cell division protein SepF [Erysipelotrichaceae bacterium]MBQ1322867.1 cell division protein SepF [Erysipelotrichaceae bacterium]MBQ1347675.1 cell division protein SepF [Erysipelotrichaceae bacterium]MBQ1379756.1 cell division protein SepF [Erysipelotrichaceae bacterium]MBQ1624504.1 cell division protein SepF [Erysipelotrichaceae bacterium]
MGFGDRLKEFIAPEEDEEEQLELTKEEAEAVSPYEKNLSSSSAITANTNIVLFEPRNFDEAEEIGHHIKSKRACCVNLHRMPSEYRQRIIDFLSGVVYGVDGSIKKVGENVILCSPKNLQVGGDINLNSDED